MSPSLGEAEQSALWQLLGWCGFALSVALAFATGARLPGPAVGLGAPRPFGARVTLAGIVLTLPVGLWLATTVPDPWGSPLHEFLQFLLIVPEHYLLFAAFAALLLPGRRLAWPPRSAGRTPEAAFALAAAGVMFGLAHVGKPHVAEVAVSFPLGLMFAWMTMRTSSIWPAVVAHCTMNLIPMALVPAGP